MSVEEAVGRVVDASQTVEASIEDALFPSSSLNRCGEVRRTFFLVFAAAAVSNEMRRRPPSLAFMLSRGDVTYPDQKELSRLSDDPTFFEPASGLAVAVDHDGAAIVVDLDRDSETDVFGTWARGEPAELASGAAASVQFQAHTVLVDCFVLGMLQRAGLNGIADSFAAMADSQPRLANVLALEKEFASFKAFVWWHHVTQEETANRVLRAYQIRHGLDDFLAEVARDLGQYSSQIQTLSAARSSAAVTILTVTLVPLTVLLAIIVAVLPSDYPWWAKCLALGASVPLALLVGIGVLSFMKGYLEFLRDVIRPDRG
jgi:hypothetical protein